MIQWDEKYLTGVGLVDRQHKTLFSMINNFEKNIRESTAPEKIEELIQFLAHYTQTHFGDEEYCMHVSDCPIAAKNKEAHRDFLDQFVVFQSRFKAKGFSYALATELSEFVEKWFVNHIGRVDVHLKKCGKES